MAEHVVVEVPRQMKKKGTQAKRPFVDGYTCPILLPVNCEPEGPWNNGQYGQA